MSTPNDLPDWTTASNQFSSNLGSVHVAGSSAEDVNSVPAWAGCLVVTFAPYQGDTAPTPLYITVKGGSSNIPYVTNEVISTIRPVIAVPIVPGLDDVLVVSWAPLAIGSFEDSVLTFTATPTVPPLNETPMQTKTCLVGNAHGLSASAAVAGGASIFNVVRLQSMTAHCVVVTASDPSQVYVSVTTGGQEELNDLFTCYVAGSWTAQFDLSGVISDPGTSIMATAVIGIDSCSISCSYQVLA